MKNLKNEIRKTLVETKKNKENKIIESKIVKSRLKAILESTPDFKSFKKLPFERQWEIGVPLMQEIAYLKELGVDDDLLITEGGIWDMLGSIFGTGMSSGAETIFEAMLSSLLKKLGLSGFIADAIIFFFSRHPSKIFESFKDCRALSKNVGQAITEAYIVKLQREYNITGGGMDFIRNALMETLENSDFGSKLADQFAEFICGFFNTIAGKGKEVMSAINTPKPAAPVASTT
jgi:hypothetical protein